MKQDQRGLKEINDTEKNTGDGNVATKDSRMSSVKTHRSGRAALKKKEKRAECGNDEFRELMLNPVEKHGKRNVYCPHYSLCLDHAIQKGWQYWDCGACPKKDLRRPLEGTGEATTQAFEYHGLAHMHTEDF